MQFFFTSIRKETRGNFIYSKTHKALLNVLLLLDTHYKRDVKRIHSGEVWSVDEKQN